MRTVHLELADGPAIHRSFHDASASIRLVVFFLALGVAVWIHPDESVWRTVTYVTVALVPFVTVVVQLRKLRLVVSERADSYEVVLGSVLRSVRRAILSKQDLHAYYEPMRIGQGGLQQWQRFHLGDAEHEMVFRVPKVIAEFLLASIPATAGSRGTASRATERS